MVVFDDIGQTFKKTESLGSRIVSLVPSQTELLSDLGVENNIVGLTAYCVKPKNLLESKAVIGGTKDLDIERIRSLRPTLIIANKEENTKGHIESLKEICPVYVSDIKDIEDSINLINKLGILLYKEVQANVIVSKINAQFLDLKAIPNSNFKSAFAIWNAPLMFASTDTFINSMMLLAGLKNMVSFKEDRYPALDQREILDLELDFLLLSSEPYSFNSKELHEIGESFYSIKLLKIIDTEAFSWYGSRLVESLKFLCLLKKELFLMRNASLDIY